MTAFSPERYELHILGAPDLRAKDGRRVTSVLSQPSRLGLLAYLALAPSPVSRASIVADFWPESDESRARNALSQALFYLRRSLGKDTVQSVEGDRLWIPPERLWCDARELLEEGHPSKEVVSAAREELLAGWNADASQPLQEWLDTLRRTVRERAARAAAVDAEEPEPVTPSAPPVASGAAEAGPESLESRRSPPGGHHRSVWPAVGIALVIAVLLLVVALPTRVRTPGEETAAASGTLAEPARLAVLLPRVTPSPGAPALSEVTLNAELLARLPRLQGLEIESVPSASTAQELRSQLDAIGAPPEDVPDFILDVSVVVTADLAHVVILLYTGTGLSVPGRDSFDEVLASPEDVAIEVPRAIAERVGQVVGAVLAP